mgnify:CR=1 FL=1
MVNTGASCWLTRVLNCGINLSTVTGTEVCFIPNSENISPAYLIFENYELILKWNRSLRFGVTICTLANMIKNEI